jgi:feruloyl esterase
VEKDEKLAEDTLGQRLDASDPDLKPFASRGGKLVMYHGWNDPAIPALNSVNYFASVRAKLGAKATDSFLRLYMVPGMLHCTGGPGPDAFGQMGIFTDMDSGDNMRLSLQQWTEGGSAPGAIIASKHDRVNWLHITMTRPLCPYPQAAKYKGTGDTTNAANFVCTQR